MLFLKKRRKNISKQNSHVRGVLFSRYCIQLQIEWYQPPICIFSVCGEITKIFSKMFQKIGKFHVIFEQTSKKCIKTKFPGWGVLFSTYCIQLQIEWYEPPICIFLVCGEITKIISKMFQKIGQFHVIFEKTSKNI